VPKVHGKTVESGKRLGGWIEETIEEKIKGECLDFG